MIELRIHRFNVDFMEFVEAEEKGKFGNQMYLVLIGIAPLLCLLEFFSTSNASFSAVELIYGLIVLAASLVLRLWSIDTLGRMWSLRIIFVPGADMVAKGPYRYFRHPEYLSRFLDYLAFVLIWQAWIGFWLISSLYVAISIYCAVIEHRQMAELRDLTA